MLAEFDKQLSQTLEDIKSQGLFKTERIITTPQDALCRLSATDGCVSMDGTIANLSASGELAETYNAPPRIDAAHATGFLGRTGPGPHEYRAVISRIAIITGTLRKPVGGASGGF